MNRIVEVTKKFADSKKRNRGRAKVGLEIEPVLAPYTTCIA